MSRLNTTTDQIMVEYRMWIRKYGNTRDIQDQRFGQYLWNTYGVSTDSFSELFYENHSFTAMMLAVSEIEESGHTALD